jgi:uncharacterized protein YbjT (DUF2867 family)
MGATGHIGQVLTEELLKKGNQVRALGRDAGKLGHLRSLGAETHTPSFEDSQALATAFQGADAVFAMIPPSYGAEDFSLYQNQVGEAITEAVVHSGVPNVLLLSSIGADKKEGVGPIANLHFQEKRLAEVKGLNLLCLRPSYFMENLFWSIPVIQGMGIHGTPLRADLKIPMVTTRDIGHKAAEFLDAINFQGTSVFELGGPRDLTMTEVTAILGQAIGKPGLNYVQFPYEDAKKGMVGSGMKPPMADLMLEMNRAFNEGRLEPTQALTANPRGTTTIEEFAKGFAGAYSQS